jgi:3-hydroxybutyryl-CoA dehydrogenase
MMDIVVCSKEREVLKKVISGANVIYVSSPEEFLNYRDPGAFIDLLFEKNEKRVALLKKLNGLVIINSVPFTLSETHSSFVRINGWPGFSHWSVIEASCTGEDLKRRTQSVFHAFNKTIEWLPDEPGFITPRVISMIINEAYFALEEGVSTKEEINTAMKLGTAYPYGPFEWAERIGVRNILVLLNRLSKEKSQYKPAPLLVEEALTAKA